MQELTVYHDGTQLCYKQVGRAGDPLLLIGRQALLAR